MDLCPLAKGSTLLRAPTAGLEGIIVTAQSHTKQEIYSHLLQMGL